MKPENQKKFKFMGIIVLLAILTIALISFIAQNAINTPDDSNRIYNPPGVYIEHQINVILDKQPNETVTITFSARIIEPSQNGIVLDYFPSFVRIDNIPNAPVGKNVVGKFSRELGGDGQWDMSDVQNMEFETYTVILPADIDNDGIVDWRQGNNTVSMQTASAIKPHLGKMEIEWIEFDAI